MESKAKSRPRYIVSKQLQLQVTMREVPQRLASPSEETPNNVFVLSRYSHSTTEQHRKFVAQQFSNCCKTVVKHERLCPTTVAQHSRNTDTTLYLNCFTIVAQQLHTIVRPDQVNTNVCVCMYVYILAYSTCTYDLAQPPNHLTLIPNIFPK